MPNYKISFLIVLSVCVYTTCRPHSCSVLDEKSGTILCCNFDNVNSNLEKCRTLLPQSSFHQLKTWSVETVDYANALLREFQDRKVITDDSPGYSSQFIGSDSNRRRQMNDENNELDAIFTEVDQNCCCEKTKEITIIEKGYSFDKDKVYNIYQELPQRTQVAMQSSCLSSSCFQNEKQIFCQQVETYIPLFVIDTDYPEYLHEVPIAVHKDCNCQEKCNDQNSFRPKSFSKELFKRLANYSSVNPTLISMEMENAQLKLNENKNIHTSNKAIKLFGNILKNLQTAYNKVADKMNHTNVDLKEESMKNFKDKFHDAASLILIATKLLNLNISVEDNGPDTTTEYSESNANTIYSETEERENHHLDNLSIKNAKNQLNNSWLFSNSDDISTKKTLSTKSHKVLHKSHFGNTFSNFSRNEYTTGALLSKKITEQSVYARSTSDMAKSSTNNIMETTWESTDKVPILKINSIVTTQRTDRIKAPQATNIVTTAEATDRFIDVQVTDSMVVVQDMDREMPAQAIEMTSTSQSMTNLVAATQNTNNVNDQKDINNLMAPQVTDHIMNVQTTKTMIVTKQNTRNEKGATQSTDIIVGEYGTNKANDAEVTDNEKTVHSTSNSAHSTNNVMGAYATDNVMAAHSTEIVMTAHATDNVMEAQDHVVVAKTQSKDNVVIEFDSKNTNNEAANKVMAAHGTDNIRNTQTSNMNVHSTNNARSFLVTDNVLTVSVTNKSRTVQATDKSRTVQATDKSRTVQATDNMITAPITNSVMTASTTENLMVTHGKNSMMTDHGTDKAVTAQTTDKVTIAQASDKAMTAKITDKAMTTKAKYETITAPITDKAITAQITNKAMNFQATDKAMNFQDIDKEMTAQVTDKEMTAQATDKAITFQAVNKTMTVQAMDKAMTAQATYKAITAQAMDNVMDAPTTENLLVAHGTDNVIAVHWTDKAKDATVMNNAMIGHSKNMTVHGSDNVMAAHSTDNVFAASTMDTLITSHGTDIRIVSQATDNVREALDKVITFNGTNNAMSASVTDNTLNVQATAENVLDAEYMDNMISSLATDIALDVQAKDNMLVDPPTDNIMAALGPKITMTTQTTDNVMTDKILDNVMANQTKTFMSNKTTDYVLAFSVTENVLDSTVTENALTSTTDKVMANLGRDNMMVAHDTGNVMEAHGTDNVLAFITTNNGIVAEDNGKMRVTPVTGNIYESYATENEQTGTYDVISTQVTNKIKDQNIDYLIADQSVNHNNNTILENANTIMTVTEGENSRIIATENSNKRINTIQRGESKVMTVKSSESTLSTLKYINDRLYDDGAEKTDSATEDGIIFVTKYPESKITIANFADSKVFATNRSNNRFTTSQNIDSRISGVENGITTTANASTLLDTTLTANTLMEITNTVDNLRKTTNGEISKSVKKKIITNPTSSVNKGIPITSSIYSEIRGTASVDSRIPTTEKVESGMSPDILKAKNLIGSLRKDVYIKNLDIKNIYNSSKINYNKHSDENTTCTESFKNQCIDCCNCCSNNMPYMASSNALRVKKETMNNNLENSQYDLSYSPETYNFIKSVIHYVNNEELDSLLSKTQNLLILENDILKRKITIMETMLAQQKQTVENVNFAIEEKLLNNSLVKITFSNIIGMMLKEKFNVQNPTQFKIPKFLEKLLLEDLNASSLVYHVVENLFKEGILNCNNTKLKTLSSVIAVTHVLSQQTSDEVNLLLKAIEKFFKSSNLEKLFTYINSAIISKEIYVQDMKKFLYYTETIYKRISHQNVLKVCEQEPLFPLKQNNITLATIENSSIFLKIEANDSMNASHVRSYDENAITNKLNSHFEEQSLNTHQNIYSFIPVVDDLNASLSYDFATTIPSNSFNILKTNIAELSTSKDGSAIIKEHYKEAEIPITDTFRDLDIFEEEQVSGTTEETLTSHTSVDLVNSKNSTYATTENLSNFDTPYMQTEKIQIRKELTEISPSLEYTNVVNSSNEEIYINSNWVTNTMGISTTVPNVINVEDLLNTIITEENVLYSNNNKNEKLTVSSITVEDNTDMFIFNNSFSFINVTLDPDSKSQEKEKSNISSFLDFITEEPINSILDIDSTKNTVDHSRTTSNVNIPDNFSSTDNLYMQSEKIQIWEESTNIPQSFKYANDVTSSDDQVYIYNWATNATKVSATVPNVISVNKDFLVNNNITEANFIKIHMDDNKNVKMTISQTTVADDIDMFIFNNSFSSIMVTTQDSDSNIEENETTSIINSSTETHNNSITILDINSTSITVDMIYNNSFGITSSTIISDETIQSNTSPKIEEMITSEFIDFNNLQTNSSKIQELNSFISKDIVHNDSYDIYTTKSVSFDTSHKYDEKYSHLPSIINDIEISDTTTENLKQTKIINSSVDYNLQQENNFLQESKNISNSTKKYNERIQIENPPPQYQPINIDISQVLKLIENGKLYKN